MNFNRTVKRFRRQKRIEAQPGAAPGTIVVGPDATPTTVHATQYSRKEVSKFENIAVGEIPDPSDQDFVWVDVIGLGDRQTIVGVANRFGIHRLSLEDVVKTHQRPKFEIFEDHLYIVVRMPRLTDDLQLDFEQVSLFIGKGYVVSWQERPGDCFDAVRARLQSPKSAVRQNGSDFLAYALVDSVIDSFFPLVYQVGDRLEDIEDELLDPDHLNQIMHQIFGIRSDVRSLRRVAWSHREMLHDWMAYSGDLTSDATHLHLRDVSDHTIRVVELLESCRENCSDLRDLHMSATSMRMNEVMKVLTVIATIFIPLGFIAGLYGMNFSTQASPWNMPETQWYLGYPIALLLMISVAGGMLIFFVRKGWIGENR